MGYEEHKLEDGLLHVTFGLAITEDDKESVESAVIYTEEKHESEERQAQLEQAFEKVWQDAEESAQKKIEKALSHQQDLETELEVRLAKIEELKEALKSVEEARSIQESNLKD